jgi:hypothetical protein
VTTTIDVCSPKRAARARWIVLGLLFVLGGYWVFSPDTVGGYGDTQQVPVTPGATLYVGRMVQLTSRDAASIDLTSVKPRVRNNSADADIQVLRCTIGTGLVGAMQTTQGSCSTLSTFHPGTVTLGDKHGQVDLLLAVTPHKPGSVSVLGVDVRYRDGIRIGSAHSGLEVDVTVPAG